LTRHRSIIPAHWPGRDQGWTARPAKGNLGAECGRSSAHPTLRVRRCIAKR
jgi:hypothetical protein